MIALFSTFLSDGIGHGEDLLIKNHYALAGYGWFLYMVGKLWYYRNDYDKNHDGLGWLEIVAFTRQNWISFFFAAMLAFILVPFAPRLWLWGTELFDKDWPVTDLVYLLVGAFILVVQLVVDYLKKKLGTGK